MSTAMDTCSGLSLLNTLLTTFVVWKDPTTRTRLSKKIKSSHPPTLKSPISIKSPKSLKLEQTTASKKYSISKRNADILS